MRRTVDAQGGGSVRPFSIRDVFADAWRTYAGTFSAHAGWSVAFIAIAILLTCLSTCLLMPLAAIAGSGEVGGNPFKTLAMVVLYVVLLVGFFGLFALHQGVTLAIARAHQRGETIVLGVCVHDASARLPTMAVVVLARILADMVATVPMIGGVLAVVATFGVTDDDGPLFEGALVALGALGAAYVAIFAWMLVVRAFLGLAGPCAQYEDVGALAALRRSVQLLAGRRLQLIGLRFAWLLVGGALYLIGFAPMILVMPSEGPASAASSLLMLPTMILGYLVALQLLAFDSLLDAALYARVTEHRSADALAEVFR